ncbi:MAG: dTDP-4-dehydrorhamnose 3,5-epimerase [Verrucomicrobia bacterium]|nr:dTDP-4-dehydrorhamnose 3,5-epimerase [Verrucomicrobiota bacterium]MBU6446376.1 dTDP-4-dehydrorhamnose 3,5-epimerase [Verrucomicrobiota bacterium]MDE3047185.1 dTDP-4-dehydrorhamnose 3,5-epimerase [Verrucomicrobiota bacterium]
MQTLRLPGLQLITPRVYEDERGYFYESYRALSHAGMPPFVQDNLSFSRQHTIRGLHFQSAPGQAKLISCLKGEIWDVAVDLRADSPTFMQWEAVHLNDQTHQQLYIPVGFAHGFCVLSQEALVHYKVSSFYHPETEKSIRWNDPDLNVAWPTKTPILSPRDQISPYWKEMNQDVVDHRM